MSEFKLRKFLSNTFICSALHTSLISCVLIPFFKSASMLPLQISLLITIKRLVRLVGDTFFGVIFDRFGAKIVFLLGRLMKLVSYFILLSNQSFTVLCTAMVIYGLSEGTIQGKVSSFIYNNLKANDKLSSFSRAMSAYYLTIDLHIALMSFIAGVLLKMYGYDLVIYISIVMNIFSFFLLLKLIPNDNKDGINDFKSKSIKNIWLTLKNVISKNRLFGYLIALYGILVFFAWQFGSIASMVLLDMGMDGTGIATLGSVIKICMAVGTLIPMFIFKRSFSLNIVSIVLLILVAFGAISAVFYNIYLFCLFMIVLELLYVVLEVSLEKNLEQFSDKTIRGTAISLAMTFGNIVAVVANLFIGLIAQYFSHKFALCLILFSTLLICCFILLKVRQISIKMKIFSQVA